MTSPAANLDPKVLDSDSTLLSLDELSRIALVIDSAIARQEFAAGRAEQAEVVALIAVSSLVRQQEVVERRRAELRSRAADRAISYYISPGRTSLGDIAVVRHLQGAEDPQEAEVRRVLVSAVGEDTVSLDDEMRAVESELAELAAAVGSAAGEADAAVDDRADIEADLRLLEYRSIVISDVLRTRIESLSNEVDGQLRGEPLIVRVMAQSTGSAQADDSIDVTASREGSWLSRPAEGPITSEFGWRWGRMHKGLDIDAPYGTPVRAAAPGLVVHAGWTTGYGYNVVIDHGGDFTTLSAHLQRVTATEGSEVARGELIGEVGSTGYSTGSHLHFETRIATEAVNPRERLILDGTYE